MSTDKYERHAEQSANVEVNICLSQHSMSRCLGFPCWDRSARWGRYLNQLLSRTIYAMPEYAGSATLRAPEIYNRQGFSNFGSRHLSIQAAWPSQDEALMGLVACLDNWIELIVSGSQAAGLHLKMKLMGLASTICLLIIVAFLLPSPVTTATTLFSHLRDSLTKIGGPRGGGGGPRGGGPHGEPSRPRAKLSSPPTQPNPLVPSFGVRRLK